MLDEDFSGWYHSDAAPTGTESVPTPEIRSDYSEAWWSSSEPEKKRRHRGRWIGALCGVVLLQGIILMCLGIQGAYMGRIFEESKGRPLYIVAEKLNTENASLEQK